MSVVVVVVVVAIVDVVLLLVVLVIVVVFFCCCCLRCGFLFLNTVGCVKDSAETSASNKLQHQGDVKGAAKYAKRTEFAAPPQRRLPQRSCFGHIYISLGDVGMYIRNSFSYKYIQYIYEIAKAISIYTTRLRKSPFEKAHRA